MLSLIHTEHIPDQVPITLTHDSTHLLVELWHTVESPDVWQETVYDSVDPIKAEAEMVRLQGLIPSLARDALGHQHPKSYGGGEVPSFSETIEGPTAFYLRKGVGVYCKVIDDGITRGLMERAILRPQRVAEAALARHSTQEHGRAHHFHLPGILGHMLVSNS